MQKENNPFHSFIITHRNELKKAINNYESDFSNIEDKEMRFIRGVQYAICIIRVMPYFLTAKRTEDANVTELSNTLSYFKPGIELLYENDLMYEGLYDEIIDFIDLDIITSFNLGGCKSQDNSLSQVLSDKNEQIFREKDVRSICYNQYTENTIKFNSPYKYLERYCFLFWIKQTQYRANKKKKDLPTAEDMYISFKTSSWFGLLEQICDSEEDYPMSYRNSILSQIVEDYTDVTNEEDSAYIVMALKFFYDILYIFKHKYNPIMEMDDRPNICGIIFPKAITYDDYRINFAADFVVENGLIDPHRVELFKRIMREEHTPLPLDFHLGPYKNGKQNKTGGKGALYWIIRYVKEPYNLEGKSASYDSITSKFRFNGIEINFKKLSDTGRGSNMKEDVITYMKNKEKDEDIHDGLLK